MRKYFTQILIGSGFLGFSLTLLLYFYSSKEKQGVFHEITIDQNAVTDSFNRYRIAHIRPMIDSIAAMKKRMQLLRFSRRISPGIDSFLLKNRQDSLKLVLNVESDSAYKSLLQQLSLYTDPLRKSSGKILKLANADSVLAALERDTNAYHFQFLVVDTVNKDVPFKITYPVAVEPVRTNVDFFIKYPSFGLWALSVTTLISIWFILGVVFFVSLHQFQRLVNSLKAETGIALTRKKMISYFLFSFSLVVLFFLIGKVTVYDKTSIVPVGMFINHYLGKFVILLASGLLVASIFFGGYLIMGDILKECAFALEKTSDPARKSSISVLCDAALKNLEKYFITTAFSLTGVTIVTGILFSAINSLEFSRLYHRSFEKDFLKFDTVYLFGGLYSLLILLFYLPLRLTFSGLKTEKVIKEESEKAHEKPGEKAGDKAVASPLYKNKDFLNRAKEIFTVSTPLLAGLIQLIIEFLSNL